MALLTGHKYRDVEIKIDLLLFRSIKDLQQACFSTSQLYFETQKGIKFKEAKKGLL